MMEVMDGIVRDAGKKIDILSSSSSSLMNEYISANQATNSKASKIIIIVVVLIMISLLVGGFYYVKEITKPIENLASIVKKVTLGNLDFDVHFELTFVSQEVFLLPSTGTNQTLYRAVGYQGSGRY